MARDDGGPAFDQCWMVWFREGFQPAGRWYTWERTAAMYRRDSLAKLPEWLREPGMWRSYRRRGLMRCVRTTLAVGLSLDQETVMRLKRANNNAKDWVDEGAFGPHTTNEGTVVELNRAADALLRARKEDK
ncbi:MAG: hypothetical protein KAJ55_00195 [Anaerolineales bacterium]|nr:hypothetical protein [Anaerolineales bacterium]